MYIWTGIIVEGQLEQVKSAAIAAEKKMGIETLFDFPQHVSVKISFYVPDEKYIEVVDFLDGYFQNVAPFEMPVNGIEREGTIVWVRMNECDELIKIQNDLNSLLAQKYGVSIHEYDLDFKFHSTLYMGDESDAKVFFEQVKNAYVPPVLKATKAGIGIAKVCQAHEFKVIKEVMFN